MSDRKIYVSDDVLMEKYNNYFGIPEGLYRLCNSSDGKVVEALVTKSSGHNDLAECIVSTEGKDMCSIEVVNFRIRLAYPIKLYNQRYNGDIVTLILESEKE